MAYTEAPESLRNLAKQRFRWAYGTLQCLWKHRTALFTHGASCCRGRRCSGSSIGN